eukprot:TRINITY_DN4130_c0_g1_i1.p1 TRINITY_DN4130_c0_g1~~TRINITY_DN4130_c0_g1_i1.p1  ORF type:complete len:180 (-),score=45.16 TRINITY_DN4130_c0_g1_i1:27-566(-)
MSTDQGENTVEYWKAKYLESRKESDEIEEMYTQYVESAQLLEEHLEGEIKKALAVIIGKNNEIDDMKEDFEDSHKKLLQQIKDNNSLIEQLEKENAFYLEKDTKLKKQVMRLETENENHENKIRQLEEDIRLLNIRLSETTEENIMTKMELEEIKTTQTETEYKLLTELRELKEKYEIQ